MRAASGHEIGQRHPADVAADARQSLVLDHRPDIVQDGGADGRRLGGRNEHGDEAAARGADERRVVQAHRGDEVEHVEHLDLDGVVPPIGIEFGEAAAAVVERVDGARHVLASAERDREVVEVAAVAREAGEAQHGPPARSFARCRIAARVQAQTVP